MTTTMSGVTLIGWGVILVWGGCGLLVFLMFTVEAVRQAFGIEHEKRYTRDLPPETRALFEEIPSLWCMSCRITELVCDMHPRIPFESCDCPDGLPRACPECQEYDVTALLEEIAELRSRVTS